MELNLVEEWCTFKVVTMNDSFDANWGAMCCTGAHGHDPVHEVDVSCATDWQPDPKCHVTVGGSANGAAAGFVSGASRLGTRSAAEDASSFCFLTAAAAAVCATRSLLDRTGRPIPFEFASGRALRYTGGDSSSEPASASTAVGSSCCFLGGFISELGCGGNASRYFGPRSGDGVLAADAAAALPPPSRLLVRFGDTVVVGAFIEPAATAE